MAHPRVLRQRNAENLERAAASAQAIAEKYPGVEGKAERLQSASGRDQVHEESARLEALADLLEAVEAETVGEERLSQPRKVEDIEGVGPDLAANLRAKGISSVENVRKTPDDQLLSIQGIGPKKLEEIREQVGKEESEDQGQ